MTLLFFFNDEEIDFLVIQFSIWSQYLKIFDE